MFPCIIWLIKKNLLNYIDESSRDFLIPILFDMYIEKQKIDNISGSNEVDDEKTITKENTHLSEPKKKRKRKKSKSKSKSKNKRKLKFRFNYT